MAQAALPPPLHAGHYIHPNLLVPLSGPPPAPPIFGYSSHGEINLEDIFNEWVEEELAACGGGGGVYGGTITTPTMATASQPHMHTQPPPPMHTHVQHAHMAMQMRQQQQAKAVQQQQQQVMMTPMVLSPPYTAPPPLQQQQPQPMQYTPTYPPTTHTLPHATTHAQAHVSQPHSPYQLPPPAHTLAQKPPLPLIAPAPPSIPSTPVNLSGGFRDPLHTTHAHTGVSGGVGGGMGGADGVSPIQTGGVGASVGGVVVTGGGVMGITPTQMLPGVSRAHAHAPMYAHAQEFDDGGDDDDDDDDASEEVVGGDDGEAGWVAGGGKKRARQPVRRGVEAKKSIRKERNREHAKRSRVRKKFLLESLQKSVDALKRENDQLRGAIRESLKDEADEVLGGCEAAKEPEDDDLLTDGSRPATKILDDPDYTLVKALQMAQQSFLITDPNLPDNPIVYASQGFVDLTGFSMEQILGRNCRFLQGPETDPAAVEKIRRAIEEGVDGSVCLINYREDGTTFYNQFFIAPLRGPDAKILNYVGVQCKVSEEYAKEVMQAEKEREKAQARDSPPSPVPPLTGIPPHMMAYTRTSAFPPSASSTAEHIAMFDARANTTTV